MPRIYMSHPTRVFEIEVNVRKEKKTPFKYPTLCQSHNHYFINRRISRENPEKSK